MSEHKSNCPSNQNSVPPEWRIEPKDASVTVGKTAVIDCQADSFPAARIEWRLSQGKSVLPKLV